MSSQNKCIAEGDPGSGERSLSAGAAGCEWKPRTPTAIAGSVNLLLQVLQSVLECRHCQLSRVFTIQRRTYKVCYKCGREFEYSWALMRSVQPNNWRG